VVISPIKLDRHQPPKFGETSWNGTSLTGLGVLAYRFRFLFAIHLFYRHDESCHDGVNGGQCNFAVRRAYSAPEILH